MLGKVTSTIRGFFTGTPSSSTPSEIPLIPRAGNVQASAASPVHGNSTSGTRPGSFPDGVPNSEAESGLKPKEASLTGYLMARSAMHRKIDNTPDFGWKKVESRVIKTGAPIVERTSIRTDTLNRLRAGHQSVQEVSDLMPLGRANVTEDIEKAKDAHLPLRILASQELRIALKASLTGLFRSVPKDAFTRGGAAVGQYAQTGVCSIFAANTAPLHAAKLAAMKDKQAVVAQAQHTEVNHAWAEMIPHGKGKDEHPILHGEDVIMDGWCKENLAILREDGEYSRLDQDGKGGHLRYPDLLDYQSGPRALKLVEKYKARIENKPDLRNIFHAELDSHVKAGTVLEANCIWDAESVFHGEFRQQASAALHKNVQHVQDAEDMPIAAKAAMGVKESPEEKAVPYQARQAKHASLAEIQAIGVALSLGSNIRGAKAEAPGIIASAKELFPLPEPVGN